MTDPKPISRARAYQLRHQAAGLCTRCNSKAEPGKTMCQPHLDYIKGKVMERYRRQKGKTETRAKAPHGVGKIQRLEESIAKHKEWISRYEKELKELKAKFLP